MEVNCRSFFQDFNPSKFVVYTSVLIFLLLIALLEDGVFTCSYWLVFLPLFCWKFIAIVGAITGCVVHCRQPTTRIDFASELEYRGMILCMGESVLLLMFEVLCAFKLDSQVNIMWSLIFVPLLFVSLISIIVCIWAVKREKNFEFEVLFGVNILQFVFIALKLDNLVDWSWVIIFVPLWVVLCLSLIGVLYAVVLAVLLIRSIDLLPEHRRHHLFSAVGYTFLVVPMLIFLVLLTKRLDGQSDLPYVLICLPLYVSLLCMIFMACGTRGGNHWWFGFRKDFCHWLLESCPVLQEYGNISYRWSDSTDSRRALNQTDSSQQPSHSQRPSAFRKSDLSLRDVKSTYPIVSIECPD